MGTKRRRRREGGERKEGQSGWRKVQEGKLGYTWSLLVSLYCSWAETKAKGDVCLQGRGCPLAPHGSYNPSETYPSPTWKHIWPNPDLPPLEGPYKCSQVLLSFCLSLQSFRVTVSSGNWLVLRAHRIPESSLTFHCRPLHPTPGSPLFSLGLSENSQPLRLCL